MPVAGQGLGVLKLKEGRVSGPCPARGEMHGGVLPAPEPAQ